MVEGLSYFALPSGSKYPVIGYMDPLGCVGFFEIADSCCGFEAGLARSYVIGTTFVPTLLVQGPVTAGII